MNGVEIVNQCRRDGLTLRVVNGDIGIQPRKRLTPELTSAIKAHKAQLLDILTDLHEAREERAAILEYDYGWTRDTAEREATRRIQLVECYSCKNWTGQTPCSAGLETSGDPWIGAQGYRICSFHDRISKMGNGE